MSQSERERIGAFPDLASDLAAACAEAIEANRLDDIPNDSLGQAFGVDTQKDHVCIWTNTYGKGRVFGTTLVHHNHHMEKPEYLDLVTRGLLWSCDKLDAEGKPVPGYASKFIGK